jgi:FkbM family methyltransferase
MIQLVEGTMHPAFSLTCLEEERDFRERYWKVREGDVVVDAGASYGAYTLTALDAGASFVFAFEPEPSIAEDLRRNLAANGWEDRCAVVDSALWDCPAVVDMKDYAPHWPAQTITRGYPAARLDDMVGTMSRLDWFKLDVEGAELQALRGAEDLLTRLKPRVIVESHTFLDPELTDKCRAILAGYGYNTFEVVPRDPCEMLIARPR